MVSRCDITDPTGRSSRDQEVKAEVYAPCPQAREKRRSGQCQESSQSEDYGLSRQEEVPSTSHDQEDTKSSLPNALQVKKNELVEFLLSSCRVPAAGLWFGEINKFKVLEYLNKVC
ncbi:hypothetical protein CapIbe_023247 [Capra ibex]